MEGEQFWLVLLSGVVIGMLLSIGLRWTGKKLLGKPRSNKKTSPESNPTETTN